MDSFINFAKQGFEKYEESQNQNQGGQGQQNQGQPQSDFNKTGGAEFNSPDHHNGGRPQASGQGGVPDLDDEHIVNTAQSHGSGESDLFSQGLSFVKGQLGSGSINPQSHEIDEDGLKDAHTQAYQNGNASSLPASSLGAAAAMQAIKNFTSGGGSSSGSSGGNMQSKLIGMAMAEASKLFESQGAASGNKQDAVNGAASTVMKFLLKSQLSSFTGGGNSGGLGQLAGLAGKFF